MIKVNLLKTSAALVFGFAMSTAAYAEKVLHIATWQPPSHFMNAELWPTWGKWVEEATEGRVKVKLEYGMGHPKSLFNIVEDGVADASWSYHGYVPGRFKLPQVVELPGLGVNAEAASVGLWRVQQEYFNKANEFEGLVLAGMFTHGPGYVHTINPITGLDQLEGKKIRIGGGIQTELGRRLNITGVASPGSKVYEMLQQGVVDGVFMPINEQKGLRLSEVAPNVYKVPGGMYLGSFSIFLNPDFLDSIGEKDRDAILSVSGEKLSALAGSLWDAADIEGAQHAKEMNVSITEGTIEEFGKYSDGLREAWLEEVSDRNVDAKAALATLIQIAQNYGK